MITHIYVVGINLSEGRDPMEWFFTNNPTNEEIFRAIEEHIAVFNPKVNQYHIDTWTDALVAFKASENNFSIHGTWDGIPVAGCSFPVGKYHYRVLRRNLRNNTHKESK